MYKISQFVTPAPYGEICVSGEICAVTCVFVDGPVRSICSIHASLKVLKFDGPIVIELTLRFKRSVTAFAAS